VSEDNSSLDQVLDKGFLLLKGKLMQAAGNQLRAAIELDPKLARSKITLQLAVFYKEGAVEAALNLGRFLIKLEPSNYQLHNLMGNCARRLKLRDLANQHYQAALQLKPDYDRAWLNWGANLAMVEVYDLEVQAFIDTHVPEKKWHLPGYQESPNLISELAAELSQAGVAEPGYAEISQAIQNKIKNDWKNYGPEQVQQVLQRDHYNLGLYALQNRDFSKASETFGRLVAQKANLPKLSELNILASLVNDPQPEQLAPYEKLAAENPYDRELILNLGVTCLKIKKNPQAQHYLCLAANLLARSEGLISLPSIIAQAEEYAPTQQLDRAVALYQEVILAEPRVEVWARLGELYLAQGDPEQGIDAYLQMKKVDPSSAFVEEQLNQVRDLYLKQAEELIEAKHFSDALVANQKATQLNYGMETLRQEARIQSLLSHPEEVERLQEKIARLKQKLEEDERERVRQAMYIKGKILFKEKNYMAAAKVLEDTLSMKKDKEIFMFLAGIYKSLKQQRALNNLLFKWKAMPDPRQEEEGEDFEDEETKVDPEVQFAEIASRPEFY